MLSEVSPIFETVGLAVHGLEKGGGEMKTLGVELDRYWWLYGSVQSPLVERRSQRGDVGSACRAWYTRRIGQETCLERVSTVCTDSY